MLRILFISAFFISLFLISNIVRGNSFGFDIRAMEWAHAMASDTATFWMKIFSFLGSHYFLIPANVVLIIYFLLIHQRINSIKVPAVAISSLIIMLLLKFLFQRPRPQDPLLEKAAGFSFPSGHSLMSVTFYGLMIYLILLTNLNRTFKFLFTVFTIILIALIGFSRIYLRVHYASDVVAGFCIGIIWLLCSLFLLNKSRLLKKDHLQS